MSAPPRAVGAQPTGSLAAGRLGVPAVLFFVMSAATPLTVVAGVVTTGFATTGLTGIPVAFVVIGLVLAVFSVGYVAMARNLANAGAFYTFVARGVGRPAGVGASWVALVAYNALQVGLYGAIGSAAGPLLDEWFGINPDWWAIALVCWAIVALLGVLRIDVNGIVLAVLLCAEVVIILVYSFADLGSPAGGAISTATLDPGNLFGDGVGAILVLALLGFVGFEASVVFSEEAKDPKRTVRTATYVAVAATAVLYTFASWAMTVATGPDTIVERSQQESVGLIFGLAGANLGGTWVTIGEVLFATSVIAAMISFHNTIARYMFALGRERVLPAALGRTSAATQAPRNASIVQSVIGLVVIVIYAIGGWEPTVHLFFWAGTSGGLGVLFLITLTALAVLLFFRRDAHGESPWSRLIAPAIALVALAVVVVLAVANFDALLGVAPDSALAWAIPAALVVIGLLGAGYGLWLKTNQPDVYVAIGSGGSRSTTVDISPTPAAPHAETKPEVKPEPEAKADADATPLVEADADAKPVATPEVKTDPDAKSIAKPEAEADADPVATPGVEADAEPIAKAEADADADAEAVATPEIEAEAGAEPEVTAEADAEPKAEAKVVAKPKARRRRPAGEAKSD